MKTPRNLPNIPQMRRICEKYGVELVENRKEWAKYLRDHGMKVEVDPQHGLLLDGVHQSKYGVLVINENIFRHLPPETPMRMTPPAASPLERDAGRAGLGQGTCDDLRLELDSARAWPAPPLAAAGSRFLSPAIGSISSASRRRTAARPASCWTVCLRKRSPVSMPVPLPAGAANARPSQGSVGDIGPHGIAWWDTRTQTWTIRVTDDEGNYRLAGSVTGFDGTGNMLKPFTGNSGQIRIPSELWRHGAGCVPFLQPWDGKILNKAGDAYTFDVYRACKPIVDFHGKGGAFRVPLFRPANQPHV